MHVFSYLCNDRQELKFDFGAVLYGGVGTIDGYRVRSCVGRLGGWGVGVLAKKKGLHQRSHPRGWRARALHERRNRRTRNISSFYLYCEEIFTIKVRYVTLKKTSRQRQDVRRRKRVKEMIQPRLDHF